MITDIIRKGSEAGLNVFPRAKVTELGHHKYSEKTPHDWCAFAPLPYALQGFDCPAFITMLKFEAGLRINHVYQLNDRR